MEIPYLTVTPAVARELTVGFTLSMSVYSTGDNAKTGTDIAIITITKTGESYLYDATLQFYLDGNLANVYNNTNNTSGTGVSLGTVSSNSSVGYISKGTSVLIYNTYPNAATSPYTYTQSTSHSLYCVLSGTDDNGETFSVTSNTITVYDYTYESDGPTPTPTPTPS